MKQIVCIVFFLALLQACDVQRKVATGKEAYELKQYSTAIEMLSAEYSKTSNPDSKSYLAYLAGQSSMAIRDIESAIDWYEKSLRLSDQEKCRFALAKAYKQSEDYEKALAFFEDLTRKNNIPEYTEEYRSLKFIVDNKKNQADPSYKIIPSQGNTNYNEYSPFFIEKDMVLFSSDRPGETDPLSYDWTGNYFSDLYVLDLSENQVKPYDVVINTLEHEGSACLNKLRNEIYYTRCEELELRDKHCRIYMSTQVRGVWTDPVAISFFDEQVNVGHPALMADDSLMIFSVGPHGNYDSYDLYYSRRLPTGWTKASYLEGAMNTAWNEKFPTSEMDTLYFSSDDIKGLGGLDIYKCYIKADGTFSRPVLLPAPINSGADDFGLVLRKSTKDGIVESGIFTSSRGSGANDELVFYEKQKVTIEEPIEEPVEEEKTIRLFLAGKVTDANTNENIAKAKLEISLLEPGRFTTDNNGNFVSEAELNKEYKIKITKEGYFSQTIDLSSIVDLKKVEGLSKTINFSVKLVPIELDKEIVIDNIFYDYDKADIRQDAQAPLDSLTQLLKENPGISIELASHTDCRGEVDYNLDLSERRAISAVRYIVSKGIDTNRLKSRGYGEGYPTNLCNCDDCSETDHQANRRTTFKVLAY